VQGCRVDFGERDHIPLVCSARRLGWIGWQHQLARLEVTEQLARDEARRAGESRRGAEGEGAAQGHGRVDPARRFARAPPRDHEQDPGDHWNGVRVKGEADGPSAVLPDVLAQGGAKYHKHRKHPEGAEDR